MKILAFQEKNDLEDLKCKKKVKLISYYHRYSKRKKVKLVTIEFNHYVIIWWDPIALSRKRI
jgi:hypothetical protein